MKTWPLHLLMSIVMTAALVWWWWPSEAADVVSAGQESPHKALSQEQDERVFERLLDLRQDSIPLAWTVLREPGYADATRNQALDLLRHHREALAGLWQVPAGLRVDEAQCDPANRLDYMEIMSETTPSQAIALCLVPESGGGWRLGIDLDDDGAWDQVRDQSSPGARRSDYQEITTASGLIVTTMAAGGVHGGECGLSEVDWSYRRCHQPLPAATIDRRPLAFWLPGFSPVSPVTGVGERWSVDHDLTAVRTTTSGATTTLAINHLGARRYHVPVALDPEGPIKVDVTQSGTPASMRTSSSEWTVIDLAQPLPGLTPLVPGEALLFAYGLDYEIDGMPYWVLDPGTGASTSAHAFDQYAVTRFDAPGEWRVRALSPEGVELSRFVVTVTELRLPRLLVRTGSPRRIHLDGAPWPAEALEFRSSDDARLTVTTLDQAGTVIELEIRSETNDEDLALEVWSAEGSRRLASRRGESYRLLSDARSSLLVDNRSGWAGLRFDIEPALPDVGLDLRMFSS